MNLKHGFYSTNTSINPDSVMMQNAITKRYFLEFEGLLEKYLRGEILPPGGFDLVCRLVDIALPFNSHLLPKSEEWHSFAQDRGFDAINRINREKTTVELVKIYESHQY